MATMNVEDKVFQLPIDIIEDGVVTKTLATADTYLDKNIKVTVTTPDGELEVKDEGTLTTKVSTTDTTYTSNEETPYAITIAADANITDVVIGVKTPGFVAQDDTVTVEATDAEQDAKVIYVKEGHLTGESESTIEGNVILTKVGAQPETGFYVKATADGSVKVDKAGWLPLDASADANSEAFYSLKEVRLTNAETNADNFTEIKAPILTEDGYLFINEGYIKDTKISLATLVPDDANITNENAEFVYNTVTAYDKDGKLIVGTMGDVEYAEEPSDYEAEVWIPDSDYGIGWDVDHFHLYGQSNAYTNVDFYLDVVTPGYAEEGIEKTLYVRPGIDASVETIELGVTADNENITVTPVIGLEASTAKVYDDIQTDKPTENHYIAVSAAAISGQAVVSPNVIDSGYGDTEHYEISDTVTITAGTADSGIYYVPIQNGSLNYFPSGDTTIVNATATVATDIEATEGFDGNLTAGILNAAPETGEYITISADAETVNGSVSDYVTILTTEGYIEDKTGTETISGEVEVDVTEAAKKYIRIYDGTILE